MIRSLQHVALIVPDLKQAHAFYTRMGLESDVENRRVTMRCPRRAQDQVRLIHGPRKSLAWVCWGIRAGALPVLMEHLKAHRLEARAIGQAVRSPEIRQQLLDQGAEPVGNTPEEFSELLLKEEVAKWCEVVRASGLKAE